MAEQTKKRRYATAEQKLEMAKELVRQFDAMCKEAGVEPEVEIVALAAYTSATSSERAQLFSGGLR